MLNGVDHEDIHWSIGEVIFRPSCSRNAVSIAGALGSGMETLPREVVQARAPIHLSKSSVCYCGLVGPVTRSANGVWHVTHNFEMLPEQRKSNGPN
jgi:hypothetical protein